MKHTLLLFFFSLFVFSMSAQAQTDTLYVDADAGAPGDGTAWSTAYPALQDAFDKVNANPGIDYEIWIAQGTYYPDTDNVDNDGNGSTEHADDDASESFTLTRDGVAVYGGFSGGETDRSARDPDATPVVLSGDLEQNDQPFEPNTDSDATASTPSQTDHLVDTNATNILLLDGVGGRNISSATVLDGLTITGGKAVKSQFPQNVGGDWCAADIRTGIRAVPP